ncbi:MAG: hypothetical protein L6R35_003810 [Caloplaca aegaea]|nr:MAG: hypothetical protein L6R35_003810 [Caloplaca aegaea]
MASSEYPVHLFVAAVVILSAVAYLPIVIIYRLFFHPLAAYPGPVLARITNAYTLYHAWTGRRHLDLFRLHHRYGSVVRIGPNNLSFNSDTAYHQIYGTRAHTRKADYYKYSNVSTNIFSTLDHGAAVRKRRICAPGFAERSLKSLEPFILANIDVFCDRMMTAETNGAYSFTGTDWSAPRDIAHWTNCLSFDIIGDICYGKSFETLTSTKNICTLQFINGVSKLMYVSAQMTWIIRCRLHYIAFLPYIRAWHKFVTVGTTITDQRMQTGLKTERRDVFQYLLEAKDPETGHGLSKQQIMDESNAFLIAGSETVSAAFSSTLFYLLHKPHTLLKLTRQIRAHFPTLPSATPISPLLTNLPYLRACIDEAMRLSPPTTGIFPRQILAPGASIDGHWLPADTQVGVCQYVLHRNAAYFKRPEVYEPERWMTDDEEARRAKHAFVPFSLGPRTCFGKGLAYAELTIGLARLLWRYDVKLAECQQGRVRAVIPTTNVSSKDEPEFPLEDCLIACIKGPMVQFRPTTSENKETKA